MVYAVVFLPDGRSLITTCADGTVKVWDIATAQLRLTLTGHKERVVCAAISADGRLLATAGNDPEVRLWDVSTGGEVGCVAGHEGCVNGLVFSPDGTTLFSAGSDSAVNAYDVYSNTVQDIDSAATGSALLANLASVHSAEVWLEAFKFVGVASFFVAIVSGLHTIVLALRYQRRAIPQVVKKSGTVDATAPAQGAAPAPAPAGTD